MFHNIFDAENKEEQRRRLKKWIAYHLHIIRNIHRLNTITKRCIGIISLVVSLVCALTANEIINRVKPLATCCHLIGWLGMLAINCLTGQQIIDQTESITTNIVCSEWYKADIRIQKDIIIILANTQRSFVLGALPLGTLDMALFILIIKSSYSYLTLLTNFT
uniref:Odorant receptor 43a-like n=1 Tax=Diabrotica virgifera virgifera TaxID=50390 RepID=A0A6P7GZB3_DIAVI